MRLHALFALSLGLLAACGGVGPRTQDILSSEAAVVANQSAPDPMPFALVNITTENAQTATRVLKAQAAENFLPDTNSGGIIIGRSDVLQISIVTTSETGFIDLTNSTLSPISTTPLPAQEVGTDGKVSVPPLGRVTAQGLSVQAFERSLERQLSEVLVDPSVIVSLVERRSARVSVLGSVAQPGIYPINQNNTHLVEILAEAGGPDGLPQNLEVSISRRGQTGRALLVDIYETPRLNIHIMAGDVISVTEPANRLTVLGAGGVNTTIVYNEGDLTLAEALGRSGGLINRRADRTGVFIYRILTPTAAQALGIDTTGFGHEVPTVFNIDLSEPQSLFAAQAFQMSSNDLIYIANGTNEEINSVFSVFTNFSPTPAEFVRDNLITDG